MRLDVLFGDQRNTLSRASPINGPSYRKCARHLQSFKFWPGKGAEREMWEHQAAAASFTVAYLAAERAPGVGEVGQEAALVKIPTGGGKSALIGILCRCLPEIKRVLVLTPREALRRQILDYIDHDMWIAFGVTEARGDAPFSDPEGVLCGRSVPVAFSTELLPTRTQQILTASETSERMILAGTLQALDQIRRQSVSVSEDDILGGKVERAQRLLALLKSFDLVIVDEGHYEPAISWSRAVRDADRPTILFSATPYRNDYKSFRVRGRFVFNQPIMEALDKKIVRSPRFIDVAMAPEESPQAQHLQLGRARTRTDDTAEGQPLTDAQASSVRSFAEALVAQVEQLPLVDSHASPKIMVRADSVRKLRLLQSELEALTGDKPLLIHDAEKGADHSARRYKSVISARKHKENKDVRFWLHQSKLLEGVDDPSFVAVALYDAFGNARQLVQQIGRVLRSSDPARASAQTAYVLAPKDRLRGIEASWDAYLAFEQHCAGNVQHVVISEAALPDRLLANLPEYQYVTGEFRPRFMLDGLPSPEDICLPTSAGIFDLVEEVEPSDIAKEVEEAILSRDRFKPMRLAIGDDAVCILYYGWRSSPYLRRQFFPEWTFGVCLIVKSGTIVLAHDTEGIVFNGDNLGIRRVEQDALSRAIPPATEDSPVRITRISSAALDTSTNAVRSQALRTHSFETFFSDFSSPGMVPTSAYGFVAGRGRYLGFARSRLRDATGRPVPLPDYIRWAREVAAELDAERKRNPVFDRYAILAPKPDKDGGTPLSILVDLADSFGDFLDSANDDGQEQLLDTEHFDLCADVTEGGSFKVNINGVEFTCTIIYNETTGRYALTSDELDEFFEAREQASGRRGASTFSEIVNKAQAFRIIPKEPNVVYAGSRVYSPQGLKPRPDGTMPQLDNVVAVPVLAEIPTEKGEKLYFDDCDQWRHGSLFGLMEDICLHPEGEVIPAEWGELGTLVSGFDLVVCDDDQSEVADFLAINTSAKVACTIHAKASKTIKSTGVGGIQEVGRQALASLGFCSTIGVRPNISPDRWDQDVNANGVHLVGRHRVFKNSCTLDREQIRDAIIAGLSNRSWSREVWIVAARLLDRAAVEKAASRGSNRIIQLLMYLDTLTTACARGNVRLRIFCHSRGVLTDGDDPE